MNTGLNSRKFNNKNGFKKIISTRKLISMLILTGLITQIFIGCKAKTISINNKYYYSFTDSLKNTIHLKDKPQRVVSLVGSYAETWILAGGELVGVTNDVISERKMEVSKETKMLGTIKDPNVEEIIALSPEFVLLSTDIESHVRISETLKKSNIPFAFFKVEHFEDYLNMLKVCTEITGNKELYEKNGLAVKKQIENILAKIDKKNNPDVLFIRAFSSGAKAKNDDNMACKILNDLGTVNIASKHKSLLEDLSIEEIIQEDPDYIFVVTMGDSKEALKALKDGIEKNPAWSSLSAVKNNRYIVLPKELFHYKPNARWGESYEYVAKILYPDTFK
ncbi:ABC transporter substrate-binding protein [Clostridium swellfunianum]|uniref:ABC transporter substrate-binding protein n=1 Tax=Clostridium swellfunianum TaxID=1367462 RepID=UPI00202FAC22|nr:ABC transporter substrate-binding protein [Clostridium swellfunianum]MCM0650684.1 ABC transporter substrate-binding protein [Clostridium swellfunianum]